MALTPDQRAQMRQLLEQELGRAVRSAIERGATPDEVADLLADRRRALAELLSGEPTDRPPPSAGRDGANA